MKPIFSLQKPSNPNSSLRVRFSIKQENGQPSERVTEPVDIGPVNSAFWKVYFDKKQNKLTIPKISSLRKYKLNDTDVLAINRKMSLLEDKILGEVARIKSGDLTKRGFSADETVQITNFIRAQREGQAQEFPGHISASLIQLFDDIIQSARSSGYYRDASVTFSPNRIKAYVSVGNNIKDFCKETKRPDKLPTLDLNWWIGFINWMKDSKGYKSDTINGKAKTVRAAIKKSKGRWQIPKDFDEWKVPPIASSDDTDPYLTEAQIDQVIKFEIPEGSEHLQRIKDWLVLACLTGQRHGDWKKMANAIIKESDGSRTVPIKQQKTKASVPIPITKGMSEILGNPATWPDVPTNQEFNRHVKKLCKLIGLNDSQEKDGEIVPLHDLITSHIGRRSFATNNYSKMPLRDLAVFTGHKTIGELEKYIKSSQLEVVAQYASLLK
jgi:integrase